MTPEAREKALAALWFGFNDAYQIETHGDEWRARRLDGLGGWMTDETPDSLRQMMADDYSLCPVRRPDTVAR